MRNLAVFAVVVFFFGIWTVGSVSESRTTDWACEMNAYFAGEPSQQVQRNPQLSGRGLLSCRNVNGFNFDIPVDAKLNITRNPSHSIAEQLRVTLYSTSFVVPRDINHVYDTFERQSAPIKMATNSSVETLLVGAERGVVVPVKISVPDEALGDWQIDSLQLEFDDAAPALSSL